MITPYLDPGVGSLGQLLRVRAATIGDGDLLRYEGQSMTFASVDKRTDQLAALLRARGIAKGDRVAVMMPNGFEFPVCWLAIAKAGAVMVPVNAQYRAHDLAYTLGDAGAAVALVDPSLTPLVHEASAQCPTLREVIPIERGSAIDPAAGVFAREWHSTLPGYDLPVVHAGDLLNIQYTSGTTGEPKGCMLTHEYWLLLGSRAAAFAGMGPSDVALTAQPFYYIDPQWNVVMCLAAGIPLVVLPRFSATTFWASVQAAGATFLYLLGTMPVFLLKQPPDSVVERSHKVRFVSCSGIVPQLHAAFEARWGVPWREAFGMTETGVDLVVPLGDVRSVGSGAAGKPIPGKEARVVNGAGVPLPDGEVGELCLRGPGMMLGYWNKPEATSERMRDGWMHTGDLASRDGNGYYHIVGRLKDMIRRGGENISAAEVEGVLTGHPAVRAVAVISVPDELRGEEAKAFVQLQPGTQSFDPRDLLAFARDRLAAFKVPRFVEFVTDLPRTPSERIAKHKLMAAHRDQRRDTYDAVTGEWG